MNPKPWRTHVDKLMRKRGQSGHSCTSEIWWWLRKSIVTSSKPSYNAGCDAANDAALIWRVRCLAYLSSNWQTNAMKDKYLGISTDGHNPVYSEEQIAACDGYTGETR